jgi:hypothetical protein
MDFQDGLPPEKLILMFCNVIPGHAPAWTRNRALQALDSGLARFHARPE